jgi:hypothetical protein
MARALNGQARDVELLAELGTGDSVGLAPLPPASAQAGDWEHASRLEMRPWLQPNLTIVS